MDATCIIGAVLFVGCVIICTYYWLTNNVFRYYVQFTYYYSVLFWSGLLVIPFALLRPFDVRNIRGVVWLWWTYFTVFRFQVDVRSRENLRSKEPYVMVCNHQSSLDVISLGHALVTCGLTQMEPNPSSSIWVKPHVTNAGSRTVEAGMTEVMPDRCTVLAKRELLFFGPFGLAAWLSGLVFVDRLNREKARKTMDMIAKLMHDKKLKLWIFPEGTRSHRDDGMLPFKKGAFNLAVSAQVPIVPVVFSSYRNFFNSKWKIFNRGKVIVQCMPPVSTEGLTADDVTALTERVREDMLETFTRISGEMAPLRPCGGKDE